jgi:2-aminoadipate transaminase
MTNWTLARRAERMNPSVIREILKVTEKPGIISLAGGLPSPKTFPVSAFAEASAAVLANDGPAALQYAASEGFAPLRQAIADFLPWNVDPDQILITTGSQQALDLIAKVLIDESSRVLVETPTYLGALQAFTPMEPTVVAVASDDEGVLIDDLKAKVGTGADKARFLYVLPNFQNPTGRTMSDARRAELVKAAAELNLPLVEDNPYGDLWFDNPPPAPLTARNPEGCIYMGSFSKVLAPGLRLGYIVAPKAVYPKLLQAKQAADLHTPGYNQRLVAEVMKGGFLDRHVPTIRALYKQQCEAMLAALDKEMQGLGVHWNRPDGGMFLWVRLPEGMSAIELLPKAVERNVAFVPGAAFYADNADQRTLRLSFVTSTVEQIATGIAALAAAIRLCPAGARRPAAARGHQRHARQPWPEHWLGRAPAWSGLHHLRAAWQLGGKERRHARAGRQPGGAWRGLPGRARACAPAGRAARRPHGAQLPSGPGARRGQLLVGIPARRAAHGLGLCADRPGLGRLRRRGGQARPGPWRAPGGRGQQRRAYLCRVVCRRPRGRVARQSKSPHGNPLPRAPRPGLVWR